MSNIEPTIRRSKHDRENPYVMISKNMIRDKELSLNAKGLLTYLLSLPDNWETHLMQVADSVGIGRDLARRLFRELIELGYCNKTIVKDKGKFDKVIYEFSEDKGFKKCLPQTEKPASVPSTPADRPLLNNDSSLPKGKEVKKKENTKANAEMCMYGPFVKFPKGRYDELVKQYGKKDLDDIIEDINIHVGSHDKPYKNYEFAVQNFYKRRKNSSKSVNEVSVKENIEYAKMMENTYAHNFYKIEVLSKHVEIVSSGAHSHVDVLKYSENGFQEQLFDLIVRKKQFYKIVKT